MSLKLSDVMDMAASGLAAQRARMAATASNLANAQTTRTAAGGPYRRRDPIFDVEPMGGPFASALERSFQRVRLSGVAHDTRAPIERFDPAHPDADASGVVRLPNVDVVEELTNMLAASRSYEANLVVVRKVREMTQAALQIGRS
jgi:flagellar basal-body rod protein FlgC